MGNGLFLRPLDVLFFRDSRPFGAGEAHLARSLFPPSPSTVHGALRARLVEDSGKVNAFRKGTLDGALAALVGSGPTGATKLGLRGPLPAKRGRDGKLTPFFPPPADFLVTEDGRSRLELAPRRMPSDVRTGGSTFHTERTTGDASPHALGLLWARTPGMGAGGPGEEGVWVEDEALGAYLRDAPNIPPQRRVLHHSEPRVGLQRSAGRTAEPGMLYQAHYVRLHDAEDPQAEVGLAVQVDAKVLNHMRGGPLALGGEGRAARWERLDFQWPAAPPAAHILQSRGLKLYLATPACFEGGWLPGDWAVDDVGRIHARLKSTRAWLVGAAVGKAVHFGGWDLAGGAPRTMARFVPAGSVYYLELDEQVQEAQVNEIIQAYHGTSALQAACDPQRADMGFGLTLVGTWKR